jgi:uncharacterized membrane protein (Fun14 family)
MEAVSTPAVPATPSAPVTPPVESSEGILHSLNAKITQFFSGLPTYASDILIFGPLGMLFGFLAKIMGRYFVFAVLVAIIAAWVAMYYGVITFDVEKLKALLGMSPTITFSDVMGMLFAWMKEHVVGCISMIIGFIIGWKIGK